MFLIAVLLFSRFSYANDGFVIFPETVLVKDKITVAFPDQMMLKELMVADPKGRQFYLVFDKYRSPQFQSFERGNTVTFVAQKLIGRIWRDNQYTEERIFVRRGSYEFYFSENLETERENTYWESYRIYFPGQTQYVPSDEEVIGEQPYCVDSSKSLVSSRTNKVSELMCLGIRAFNQENFIDAIALFEKADAISKSEKPSFEALAFIAAASLHAGSITKARDYLKTAWYSALVLDGEVEGERLCKPTFKSYFDQHERSNFSNTKVYYDLLDLVGLTNDIFTNN